MSFKAMQAVWKNSRASGGALLVLLAVADHFNDVEGCAWPGVDRLAERARLSTRHVYRLLTQLKAMGELGITQDPRRKTNVYTIKLLEEADIMSPDISSDVLNDSGRGHWRLSRVTSTANHIDIDVSRSRTELAKIEKRTTRRPSRFEIAPGDTNKIPATSTEVRQIMAAKESEWRAEC
jgi:DNA-binding IclR family transcriptional regulator